jgi:hypothetical protein
MLALSLEDVVRLLHPHDGTEDNMPREGDLTASAPSFGDEGDAALRLARARVALTRVSPVVGANS